ncbi:MAG: hypothetical protein ACK4NU_03350 [Brevundimonas sp.]
MQELRGFRRVAFRPGEAKRRRNPHPVLRGACVLNLTATDRPAARPGPLPIPRLDAWQTLGLSSPRDEIQGQVTPRAGLQGRGL